MPVKFSAIVLATFLLGSICSAQPQFAPREDFKLSTVNQPGQEYPQINSQSYARFRILAPDAQKLVVSLGLEGTRGGTPLTKITDSIWMGTTAGPWKKASIIITLPLMVECLTIPAL